MRKMADADCMPRGGLEPWKQLRDWHVTSKPMDVRDSGTLVQVHADARARQRGNTGLGVVIHHKLAPLMAKC